MNNQVHKIIINWRRYCFHVNCIVTDTLTCVISTDPVSCVDCHQYRSSLLCRLDVFGIMTISIYRVDKNNFRLLCWRDGFHLLCRHGDHVTKQDSIYHRYIGNHVDITCIDRMYSIMIWNLEIWFLRKRL